MDDKNQTVASDQNLSNGQRQPQTQTPQDQKQVAPVATSVGTTQKEQGPVMRSDSETRVSEFIKPSKPELTITSELSEIGVETQRPPAITAEHEKAGITLAKESVPVKTEPSGIVYLPMTEDEAKQTLKHAKPTNSIWGVAALVLKYFKEIHKKIVGV